MKKTHLSALTALLLAALLVFTACGQSPDASPETSLATQVPSETAVPPEEKTRTVLDTLTTEIFVGDMTITSSTVHSYDEQGLLKETISYSNGAEVSRTTVENDTHGEVIRQSTVSGENTMVTESELTYDDAGNLIHRVDTVSENGTVMDIREYTYNSDHTLAEAVITSLREPTYVTSNKFEYNEAGQEILELRTDSSGTVTRIETEYDDQGQVLRTVYKNDSGEVTQYVESIYEDNGAVKQLAYAPDGTPSPSYTLTTYNAQGNPLIQETYNGEVLSMRTTCTYLTVPAFK